MRFNLCMQPVDHNRFLQLTKMARYLEHRGAATLDRVEFWEGMEVHHTIMVKGEPVAQLAQTTKGYYYGEHQPMEAL